MGLSWVVLAIVPGVSCQQRGGYSGTQLGGVSHCSRGIGGNLALGGALLISVYPLEICLVNLKTGVDLSLLCVDSTV